MTDADPDNITLQHLRAIREKLDKMDAKLDEHTRRLGRIERTQAGQMGAQVDQEIRIDRLAERIERIEARLTLRDD